MSLKKNVLANYVGQGWAALMGLAFVPIYIKYLGVEAYGLIGIFAMLQAWLALLDMGMTPVLNREMARFSGGAHSAQSIRDLLRSIETVGFLIAVVITVTIWAVSGWLASEWLKADKLPVDAVAKAFGIMGAVTALRFLEGIYRGAIIGLQKQVLFNVINASLATLRGFGAVGVLVFVSPSINAFFIWQGLVSLFAVATFLIVVYQALPASKSSPYFSRTALQDVWRFAVGMMATTFLALLLTQVDKVILSRLLSLETFGLYTLAGLVAGSLSILSGPIAQAYYPRMTELVTRKDLGELITIYHRSAQMISVLVGSAAVMLILFGERMLLLWTGNASLAHEVAPVLALLAMGNLLNSLMIMPYMLQLAHGWSSFAVKINIIAVVVLVPAIYWVSPRYGVIGAAWVWLILNSGYVLIAAHFMHQRLISDEKWHWYGEDLALPLAASTITAWLLHQWQPVTPTKMLEICWLVIVGVTVVIAAVFAAPELRLSFVRKIKLRVREKRRSHNGY